MDSTAWVFDEWTTIISIIVAITGIIVGAIGGKSLKEATKIRNEVGNVTDSNLQQAQVINNGLDNFAVIRLTRDTTKEELVDIVERLDKRIDSKGVHIGTEPPEHGRIWVDTSEEESEDLKK